jgi:hypothetical protein
MRQQWRGRVWRGAWRLAALALLLAPGMASAPALAQTRPDFDRNGRLQGYTDRQGGVQRRYNTEGQYEGRSERSAGGGVQRHYDAQGRYLGREDVERDFRRRREADSARPGNQPPYGQGYESSLWDLPAQAPPPFPPPSPRPGGATPWFGDEGRPRGRTPWFGDQGPQRQAPAPWQ